MRKHPGKSVERVANGGTSMMNNTINIKNSNY